MSAAVARSATKANTPDKDDAYGRLETTLHQLGETPAHVHLQSARFSFGDIAIQPHRLAVSSPAGPLEQQADLAAEGMMLMGKQELQRECTECEGREEPSKKRAPAAAQGSEAPPIVNEVLGSSGSPLDDDVRAQFEPALGHDFGRVRIHADSRAAESARAVGALAYTVGRDVVFGAGLYEPATDTGRRLLAHELAHVVQQSQAAPSAKLQVGRVDSSAEAEAAKVGASSPVQLARLTSTTLQRMPNASCMALLNTPGSSSAGLGTAVHAALAADFASRVGPTVPVAIPGGSAAPLRTEGRPWDDTIIDPQVIGGLAGTGFTDIAHKRGKNMEIAEIKPATWPWYVFAEEQLARYIDNGNADDNATLRATLGINKFVAMPPSRYRPKTLTVGGKRIKVVFCSPGIILYKPIEKSTKKSRKKKRQRQKATRSMKKAGGRVKQLAKRGAGAAVQRALVYAEVAAAAVLLISGKAEASFDGEGASPLEALYTVMASSGAEVPPELREMIEQDEELKELMVEAMQSGDPSEVQEKINERIMEIMQENPDEFTSEDLKILMRAAEASSGAATEPPENAEELRAAIEAARAGKTGPGKKGEGGTQAGPKEGAPQEKHPGLSAEAQQQLAQAPDQVRRFFDAMISDKGLPLTDEFVRRFLETVPPGLTEDQASKLIEMLQPYQGESLEEAMERLRSAVAAVTAGEKKKEQATAESAPTEEKGPEKEGVTKDEYVKAVVKAINDYPGWSGISAGWLRMDSVKEIGFETFKVGDTAEIVIYMNAKVQSGTLRIGAFARVEVIKKTKTTVDVRFVSDAVLVSEKGEIVETITAGNELLNNKLR